MHKVITKKDQPLADLFKKYLSYYLKQYCVSINITKLNLNKYIKENTMTKESQKTEIIFKSLPLLLNDMERKEWIIDSFSFRYKDKGKQYIVILTMYKEKQRKPSKHAKAKVEIISRDNINKSIIAYIDFYDVHFHNVLDFCEFFGIEIKGANRDIFKDFSKIFADFIPKEKIINKSNVERKLIGSRAEGDNPKAIHCYDVRRNGRNTNGSPNKRSIENSNKAQSLRPFLFERYCKETNLSFFFSDKPEDEKSDSEIIKAFADR